ncbi:MAG: NADH-quinone oxidoreductase subunit C [Candidatus Firestonebacteria bacterium]|nr:NADH-quinone oxidoreductase subunit C [Candidatus Firestonebacteria bacterium]
MAEEIKDNIAEIEQIPAYKLLKENFPDEILNVFYALSELTIIVKKDKIFDICLFLKNKPELLFDYLADLCGVDYNQENPRFYVVYQLYSMKFNKYLRLKSPVDSKDMTIASVESIWKTANWHEREAYDMFGIKFSGHPFLRRILMDDDFEGYPLRKDFPLKGY